MWAVHFGFFKVGCNRMDPRLIFRMKLVDLKVEMVSYLKCFTELYTFIDYYVIMQLIIFVLWTARDKKD